MIIKITIKIRRFYMINVCTDILSIQSTNRLQCTPICFSTFRLQGFAKDIQPLNKRDISGKYTSWWMLGTQIGVRQTRINETSENRSRMFQVQFSLEACEKDIIDLHVHSFDEIPFSSTTYNSLVKPQPHYGQNIYSDEKTFSPRTTRPVAKLQCIPVG